MYVPQYSADWPSLWTYAVRLILPPMHQHILHSTTLPLLSREASPRDIMLGDEFVQDGEQTPMDVGKCFWGIA